MIRVTASMKSFLLFLLVLSAISCEEKRSSRLLTYEVNTSGVKHTVAYQEGRASAIIYETFHGSRSRDTTLVDSVLRREVDSINFDLETHTVLLTRLSDDSRKDFRKYYFNPDNLLTRISRFDSNKEYITDSVAYDYTKKTAFFYDVINKHVYELVYDNKNNIETETEKRTTDHHVYQTFYYYYDASSSPFLVNLDEDEELFGCFNMSTVGLFWNNASRPLFSSKNNVQSFKEVANTNETNGLFEYQYTQGLPAVQFGNDGVIYYHYKTLE